MTGAGSPGFIRLKPLKLRPAPQYTQPVAGQTSGVALTHLVLKSAATGDCCQVLPEKRIQQRRFWGMQTKELSSGPIANQPSSVGGGLSSPGVTDQRILPSRGSTTSMRLSDSLPLSSANHSTRGDAARPIDALADQTSKSSMAKVFA